MAFELKHHHGGMSVPDLEASIRWFETVLGFAVERRFDIPTIPAKVAMLRREVLRIELFEVPGAQPLPDERRQPDLDAKTHGNKHIAFAIKDVDSVAEQLRQRGADVFWVRRSPHGANIFIRDNSGNLIEFVQEPDMFS